MRHGILLAFAVVFLAIATGAYALGDADYYFNGTGKLTHYFRFENITVGTTGIEPNNATIASRGFENGTYNATDINNVPGFLGQGFNGSSGKFMKVVDNSYAECGTNGKVCAFAYWVKEASTGYGFGRGVAKESAYQLNQAPAGVATDHNAGGDVNGGALNFRILNTSSDRFSFIVRTYDGVNWYSYLNGTLISTQAFSTAITDNANALCFGKYGGSGSSCVSTIGQHLTGTIDEYMFFYDMNLSAADVSYLYNSGSGRVLSNVSSGGGGYTGPSLTLSVNDSRSNALVSGFSWNFTTTNASDVNPKSGYCLTSSCAITNITSADIDIFIFNISGGTYFNSSIANVVHTATATVYAPTFSNSVNFTYVFDALNQTNITFCVQLGDSNGTWRQGCASGAGPSIRFYNVIGMLSYNITNISLNTYFNTSGTLSSFNSTLFNVTGNSSQSYLNVSVNVLHLASNVSVFNVSNQQLSNLTTGGYLLIPARIGINNITVNVTGNYSVIQNCTGLSLTLTACSAVTYDTILNISLKNRWSNATVMNFSGFIYLSNGANATYNTTNGSTYIPSVRGNYTAFIRAHGYSYNVSENYRNISLLYLASNYTFYLYSNNTIISYIFDQSTGNPITDLVTILGQSGSNSFTNTTNTSYAISENIPDGVYVVSYSSPLWTTSQYFVTVTDGSAQTINAFLSQNTSQLVFTVQDASSGARIVGAGVSQYRLVNGNQTLIASRLTDVSGNTAFDYLPNVKYTFIASASGYVTKTWSFDPVLFSSYTIPLTRNTTTQANADYTGVLVSYAPSAYFVNQSNNFSILFYSQNGTFTFYNTSVRYPGGNFNFSGVISTGQQFNQTFNISAALFTDTVNVSYCYHNVWGTVKCFDFYHAITGVYGNTTLMSIKDADLPLLDRVVISLLVTGFVAAICAVVFGPFVGGVAIVGMLTLFVGIELLPFWMAAVSLIVGILILIKAGGK